MPFAESGARNWVHSAATVLAFLQKERGLLKPGYKFQPIIRDDVLANFDAKKSARPVPEIIPVAAAAAVIDSSKKDSQPNRTPADIAD